MKKNETRKMMEEAKAIVAFAFRNGYLERLHAGVECPFCSGREDVSRINDEEMKKLMKDAVNRVYFLLKLRERDRDAYEKLLETVNSFYTRKWDDPEPLSFSEI